MPKKAIESECVDFVLTARGIGEKISEIALHPFLSRDDYEPDVGSAAEENSLKKIFRLLRSQVHVDFSQYKRSTIQRRLGRRMALRHIQALSEYEEVLRENRAEADALAQDFLIRVTGFFRHAEDFRALTEIVFPPLLENRSQKDPLRIWVPGCASGEEVYSVAILLTEFLGDQSTAIPVQIFGTDLSEIGVAQARAGEYLSNIEREISSERLRRFFIKLDDHYQIAKPIRDLCIFARHDLTYDPPYSRLDIISCRNVLIYFDLNLQRQVVQSFHYALRPRGLLQVGPSESIGQNSELFQLVDPRYRIYRKQVRSGAIEPRAIETGTAPAEHNETATAAVSKAPDLHRAQRETDRLVINRYAPATVLIDGDLNTIYFQGDTGPYLELARGGASLKLQKILRPGLQMEVFSAIEHARNRGVPVRRARVRIEEPGQVTRANIEVVPLNLPDSAGVFYVLFFEKVATGDSPGLGGKLTRWWMDALQTGRTDSAADKDQIQHLRRELEVTREYLRNALEERETTQEELKSAHEEALSSNEEFQSTNEELESAKEELQSANEELSTTNDELRNSNLRLNQVNDALVISRDHLSAIFETLREPILVLDSELKVLQANPAFYETFNVSQDETQHRPIYELGNGQWDFPMLRHLLEGILPTDTPIRDFEVTYDFPTIGTRTMLLNGRRLAGSGDILLAIEDITERKGALEELKKADRQKDHFLAILSHELRNPLAPTVNALKLLQVQGTLNPIQQRSRDIIERQIGQLTRLVNDLLELSRLTGGAVALQGQRIALKAVVERGVETSRPYIEERQQQLSVSTPGEPVWLNADPLRLEEVLVNLLTNAAKYTDRGGHVWLTGDREGNQGVIRVRDSGIGNEREMLPHIFEMFTQSQHGLARSHGGLGIGLSVAKNLTRCMAEHLRHVARVTVEEANSSRACRSTTATLLTHRVNRSPKTDAAVGM
jgi:two-component system CheB/CheR fusion protein